MESGIQQNPAAHWSQQKNSLMSALGQTSLAKGIPLQVCRHVANGGLTLRPQNAYSGVATYH